VSFGSDAVRNEHGLTRAHTAFRIRRCFFYDFAKLREVGHAATAAVMHRIITVQISFELRPKKTTQTIDFTDTFFPFCLWRDAHA
jgi:hypothetical protein